MTAKATTTFSIRLEKSLVRELEKLAPPFSNKSELSRNILRNWVKEQCENNAK